MEPPTPRPSTSVDTTFRVLRWTLLGLVAALLAYRFLKPMPGETTSPRGEREHSAAGGSTQRSEATPDRKAEGQHSSTSAAKEAAPGADDDTAEVTATDPTAEESTDLAWERLPRSAFSFAEAMGHSPTTLAPRMLYRHRKLNPNDTYMPPLRRDELRQIFAHYVPQLRRIEAAKAGIATAELHSLVEAGRASHVSQTEVMNQLTPQERESARRMKERVAKAGQHTREELRKKFGLKRAEKADRGTTTSEGPQVLIPAFLFKGRPEPLVFSAHGDEVFLADASELPATQKAEEMRGLLVLEFAGQILAWFQANGQLSDLTSVGLLTQLERILRSSGK